MCRQLARSKVEQYVVEVPVAQADDVTHLAGVISREHRPHVLGLGLGVGLGV